MKYEIISIKTCKEISKLKKDSKKLNKIKRQYSLFIRSDFNDKNIMTFINSIENILKGEDKE